MSETLTSTDIRAKMDRLRRQVEVHSIIYYKINTSIITDAEFDTMCSELVKIQKEYPDEAKEGYKPESFEDFDGSTGMHLTGDLGRYSLAMWLVERHEREDK